VDTQVDYIKQIWVKKLAVGALVACGETHYPNLKLTFEDLMPCYCYATKTHSRTIR